MDQSNMKREIFITQKLSNGDTATIYEIKGWDITMAILATTYEPEQYLFNLVCRVTMVKGKAITMKYFNNLDYEDAMFIIESIGVQTQKIKV